MLRKFVCAVVVVGLAIGVAAAEELKGRITKIEGDKLSFATFDKETKKLGDAKTYDLAKDVKVSKMEKKEKVAVADGLKTADLTNIGPKGVQATINVTDGKVTEIILAGKKKKE